MSEPHRVRARIERVPVLAIALSAALVFLIECALLIGSQLYADAMTPSPGGTGMRGVEVLGFLGGKYEAASYAALLPIAFGRGLWAGLLAGIALEALARMAALRVTLAFEEAAKT